MFKPRLIVPAALALGVLLFAPLLLGGALEPLCPLRAEAQGSSPCAEQEATIEALESELAAAQATIAALEAQLSEAAAPAATESAVSIPRSSTGDGGFVLGDPDAPVTIVEFADFACPHCIIYEEDVVRPFIETYVASGQAAFEFRVLPTAGGEVTAYVGQLAQCADEERPGAFWDAYAFFYEQARANTYMNNADLVREFVAALDLDVMTLGHCTVSADSVTQNNALADRAGVFGTPAVMVRYDGGDLEWITLDDQIYDQGGVPLDVLAQVVEQAGQ